MVSTHRNHASAVHRGGGRKGLGVGPGYTRSVSNHAGGSTTPSSLSTVSFSPATGCRIQNSPDHHHHHHLHISPTIISTTSSSSLSNLRQKQNLPKKEIHLAIHQLSTKALKAAYGSADVRTRLTLMLALVPWSRSTAFWRITTATFAGFGCVALLLPRFRLYAVFLRQELARVLRQPLSPANVRAAVIQVRDDNNIAPHTPPRQILSLNDLGHLSNVEEEEDYEEDELDEEDRVIMNDTDHSPFPRRLGNRRGFAKSISVSTVFDASGLNSPVRPMPVERIGQSPSHTQSSIYSSTVNDNTSPIRGRSSFTNSKRLSLNFPLQPPSRLSSRPPSWHTSPVYGPDSVKSPTEGNFLTILAAQERRVLELKEELKRAEEDLNRLKNQWSAHELMKKQQQTRRVLPLQPLATDLCLFDNSEEEELDETQQLAQKEIDRRRAMLSGVRSSGRKVFSGSKHTRTLSLLSPEKATLSTPFPMAGDSPRRKLNPAFNPRGSLERSSTTPDFSMRPILNKNQDILNDLTGVPKDALLVAGKQMMGDMKDTFWTFVGDIKQATVGSEAMNGPSSIYASSHHQTRPLGRSKSHRSTPTTEKRLSKQNLITSQPRGQQPTMTYDSATKDKDGNDISSSFWREHGILESPHAGLRRSSNNHRYRPLQNTPLKNKPSSNNLAAEEDVSWDAWGTPTPTPQKDESSQPLPTQTTQHQARNGSLSSSSSMDSNTESTSMPSSPTHLLTPPSSTTTNGSEWPLIHAKMDKENIMPTTALGLMGDWESAVGGK
jgi:hypothetical protein